MEDTDLKKKEGALSSGIGKSMKQAIIVYAMLGAMAWCFENNFLNLFIDRTITTDPMVITITTAASAITAALTTLIVGTFLDRKGKRTPYMKYGYLIWGISILLFTFIRVDWFESLFSISKASAIVVCSILVIFWDCAMTFFGSSCNDAAYNMWLTDNSNKENRSRVEGFTGLWGSVGGYLVYIMDFVGGFIIFNLIGGKSLGETGLIGMTFNTYYDLSGNYLGTTAPTDGTAYTMNQGYWWIFYLILGLVVALASVMSHKKLKDASDLKPNTDVTYKDIIYGFKPSVIKQNKVLYASYLCSMIAGIAGLTVNPFFLQYLERTLNLGGLMYPYMAVTGIAYLAGSYLFGIMLDKLNNNKGISKMAFLISAIIAYSAASIALYFVCPKFLGNNKALISTLVMVLVSITSLASCLFSNILGTTMRDYSPKGRIGAFQGIRLVVNVMIPMTIGPLITGIWNKLNEANATVDPSGTKIYTYDSTMFLFQGIIMLFVIFGYVLLTKYQKEEKMVKEAVSVSEVSKQ